MDLVIYRDGVEFTTVKIDESTIYSGVLSGENEIKASFQTSTKLVLLPGDYIVHNSQQYSLSRKPQLNKSGANSFACQCVFEGPEYKLYNKLFLHNGNSSFTYYGTPETFLNLVLDNINEIDEDFQFGEVEDIEGGKFLSFDGDSCRTALTKIAEAFELEISFEADKSINLTKHTGDLIPGVVLKQGIHKGLYSLERLIDENAIPFTRIYGYGGNENLPPNYRNGSERITFDERYIDVAEDLDPSEIWEGEVVFKDIYPKYEGTVTSSPNELEIIDTSLDFNLNTLIIKGQSKVVFLSGDLANNEFEIAEPYDASNKKIKLIAQKDDSGYILPNNTVKPATGDKYTIIGIEMPESYITNAEIEVQEATENYVDSLKTKTDPYQLEIDEKFVRDNDLDGVLDRGKRVSILDIDLNIESDFRIQSISYPLSNPSKISAVLSDKILYTASEAIRKEVKNQKQDIVQTKKSVIANARDNWRRTAELTTMLEALKAEMLLIMVDGSVFETNIFATVTEDNFVTTAGSLVNQQYEGTWSVSASSNTLASNVPYYVYVKASKSTATATIVISATKIAVEEVSGFYHFMFGIISSKVEDTRVFTSTKGYTRIIGNNIQTGRISSIGGQSFFDLDDGTFFIGDENSSLDFGVTEDDTLTVRGKLFVLPGGNAETQTGATSKANAAQAAATSAAQTYAAAQAAYEREVAKAYADGIVTEEEARAIADAQAKLNEAKTDATAKINAVKVGGRNYQPNSEVKSTSGYTISGSMPTISIDNGVELKIVGVNGAYVYTPNLTQNIPNTEVITVSLWIKNNLSTPTNFRISPNGHGSIISYDLIANQGWTKIQATRLLSEMTVTPMCYNLLFEVYTGSSSLSVSVKNIKVEIGNKGTDWLPAPEDVDADATAKANAAQLAAEINSSNVATTKANAAQSAAAGYTDTKSLTTISTAQSYADGVATTKANAAQANAISTASTDAQNKANAAQAAAAILSQQLVDGVKVGGRNLALNSAQERQGQRYLGFDVPLVTNEQYTWSAEIKLNEALSGGERIIMYFLDNVNGSIGNLFITPTTVYQKFSVTATVPNWYNVATNVLSLYCPENPNKIILAKNYKLEKGNKATDWTPAPEDVQTAINTAQAAANAANAANAALRANLKAMAYQDVVEFAKLGGTIVNEGGLLRGTLLDALYIKANIVNASYIEALDIVTKRLQAIGAQNQIFDLDSTGFKITHPNGKVAARLALVDGVIKFEFFDTLGVKVYEVGQNGAGVDPTPAMPPSTPYNGFSTVSKAEAEYNATLGGNMINLWQNDVNGRWYDSYSGSSYPFTFPGSYPTTGYYARYEGGSITWSARVAAGLIGI